MLKPVPTHHRSDRRAPSWAAAGLLALGLASGCQTFNNWQTPIAGNFKDPEIGNVQGPNERRLRGGLFDRRKEESASGDPATLKPIAGTDEYYAAEAIYKEGRYAEAQAAFKKVAKKFKKSEIREDALFMQAECAHQQKHYAKEYDLHAEILKEYPSTRHLDTISKRLFEIAGVWLNDPQFAQIGEIQQVDLKEPGKHLPPEQPTNDVKQNPLALNFTDKSRPAFDPEGNAVAALRAIWLNDPTGPLADDALMLAASYYARRNKWVEADTHFSLLREQYPQSPHVQAAFVVGSHVKLMSYEGAAYDDRRLKEAKQLKETTLRLYPQSGDRERLAMELAAIETAEAARLWDQVQYYGRRRKADAMAINCHMLLNKYPESQFAPEARKVLHDLGPQYESGEKFRRIEPKPKASLLPTLPSIRQPQKTEPPQLEPVEEPAPRRWFGLPGSRKADTPTAPDDAVVPDEDGFAPPPGSAAPGHVTIPDGADMISGEAEQ